MVGCQKCPASRYRAPCAPYLTDACTVWPHPRLRDITVRRIKTPVTCGAEGSGGPVWPAQGTRTLNLPEIWPFWSLLDTSTFSGAAFISGRLSPSLLQPIFPFLSSKDTPSPGQHAWFEETIELAALDRCAFPYISFSFQPVNGLIRARGT